MKPTQSSRARNYLKTNLVKLPESNQELFKLMYGRDHGKRGVEEAKQMDLNKVIDEMPDAKLNWAVQQVENTFKKANKIDTDMIKTLWRLAEEDFEDKSTEFLMEIVCQRYTMTFPGKHIDNSDVADALSKRK